MNPIEKYKANTIFSVSYPIENHSHRLSWSDRDIGYLKSDGYEYGEDYWEIYQQYAGNDVGVKLTQARADFVEKHVGTFDGLCDVGVGSGQFVDFVKCKGTDVNPLANKWLKEKGYYVENSNSFKTLTLWDVIEHIEDPTELLANAQNVFISTPIYADVDECLVSKHLKPGEHIWYFTDHGIKYFMSLFGFKLIAEDDFETVLGRESILSYFFQKV